MAYEKLNDVKLVTLGGIDKKTGKKNPTEIEGYYLRKEEKPNKFNPGKPQAFYVFETKAGAVGIFGKASIDREMAKANIGVMTKVVDTGTTRDTGKGNPMRVFEVFQDSGNSIDVADLPAPEATDDEPEHDDEDETAEPAHNPVRMPNHPVSVTPSSVSSAQSLLSKVRSRA